MNLEEFKFKYATAKDADKIQIQCDHPNHTPPGEIIIIGKQPAKRNIMKNNNEAFICRQCVMKYDNPAFKTGQGRTRQTDEIIKVRCPHPEHVGDQYREMKRACYFGPLEGDYEQVCGSCAQFGKEISEEQRAKISEKLSGRKLTETHVANILKFRENNPEWAEKATQNLIPGIGGGWNEGMEMPEEVKRKMSESHLGKEFTQEHCDNISKGRKEMLDRTGGFTLEHRQNISKATIRQYQNGFNPKVHHVSGWHDSPKAGRVFYRSSYEKKAYLKLDTDTTVISYKIESVSVSYFHPEKKINSNYLIDIEVQCVDGSKKLIEVKPEQWLTDEVVIAKLEAAAAMAAISNTSFEVWTEMNLFGHVYNEKNIKAFAEKVRNGEI